MLPCWMCQRRTTCAAVFPIRSAISFTVASPSTWPCAIGAHASVAIPCSRSYASTSRFWKNGCSSTWFTAGTTSHVSASRSRCAAWKFETPIERARPSARNSERLPRRDEVAVVERRQRPVDEEQVDVVGTQLLERRRESRARGVRLVEAVVELARDEDVGPVKPRSAHRLADA